VLFLLLQVIQSLLYVVPYVVSCDYLVVFLNLGVEFKIFRDGFNPIIAIKYFIYLSHTSIKIHLRVLWNLRSGAQDLAEFKVAFYLH
jgi:hypothetical protein